MTEKQLQPRIIKYLKNKGWLAMKGDYSLKGMPDIIAFRNGKTLMIEVKGAGIKPPPLQLHRIDQLKSLGIAAMWTSNFDEIKLIIDIIDQKNKGAINNAKN